MLLEHSCENTLSSKILDANVYGMPNRPALWLGGMIRYNTDGTEGLEPVKG